MFIISCIFLKGILGSLQWRQPLFHLLFQNQFLPSLPQKADLIDDIGIKANLSFGFQLRLIKGGGPQIGGHVNERVKSGFFSPRFFLVRWPWASYISGLSVTVFLEAATLHDSLQWAPVPAFSLILYTCMWGVCTCVWWGRQFCSYWVPVLTLVVPLHPAHTFMNNPFG